MLREPHRPVFSPCYTEGTLRGYRAGWASWRRHHAGEPPPADHVNPETLKQFIAPLLDKGLRLPTIETYLHGVIAAYSAQAQIGELQQYDWWLDTLRAHRDHRKAIKSLWRPREASNTQQTRDMALIALSDAGMTPSVLSALKRDDLLALLPALPSTIDHEPINAWIKSISSTAGGIKAPAFPTRTGRRWSRRAITAHLQKLRRLETTKGAQSAPGLVPMPCAVSADQNV